MSRHVDDYIINLFFGKITAFLSLYDECFVGGAFIFEDPNAKLFNLLTHNNLTDNEDYLCGTTKFFSPNVSFKQSKTHGIFLNKFNKAKCVPEVAINLPKCQDSRCIKYERIINLHNICSACNDVKNRDHKGVILYYPFTYLGKRYLYAKLESHKMISTGHLTEAVKTYVLKTKTPERRENDKYTDEILEKDINFYHEISTLFNIDAQDINEYNSNLRQGAEFFVSSDLLKMFFDLFLNDDSIDSVCELKPLKLNKSTTPKSEIVEPPNTPKSYISLKSYKSTKSNKPSKSKNFKTHRTTKSKLTRSKNLRSHRTTKSKLMKSKIFESHRTTKSKLTRSKIFESHNKSTKSKNFKSHKSTKSNKLSKILSGNESSESKL